MTPVDGGVNVDIQALMSCEVPQAQLFEMLYPYGFNSRQIADIFRSLTGDAGRMFYAQAYVALKDRDLLCVRPYDKSTASDSLYTLPEEGVLELPDGTSFTVSRIVPDASWRVPKESNVCVVDAARLHYPLIVRRPQEGDRMHPFGMKGSKLLSDLYTDLKINRIERDKQWLLCQENDVLWAVGLRTSEKCRLQGNEKEVLVISYNK